MPNLPQELLNNFVENTSPETSNLINCVLAGPSLRAAAQKRLFKSISVLSDKRINDLLHIISGNNDIGAYIHTICFSAQHLAADYAIALEPFATLLAEVNRHAWPGSPLRLRVDGKTGYGPRAADNPAVDALARACLLRVSHLHCFDFIGCFPTNLLWCCSNLTILKLTEVSFGLDNQLNIPMTSLIHVTHIHLGNCVNVPADMILGCTALIYLGLNNVSLGPLQHANRKLTRPVLNKLTFRDCSTKTMTRLANWAVDLSGLRECLFAHVDRNGYVLSNECLQYVVDACPGSLKELQIHSHFLKSVTTRNPTGRPEFIDLSRLRRLKKLAFYIGYSTWFDISHSLTYLCSSLSTIDIESTSLQHLHLMIETGVDTQWFSENLETSLPVLLNESALWLPLDAHVARVLRRPKALFSLFVQEIKDQDARQSFIHFSDIRKTQTDFLKGPGVCFVVP